MKLKEVPGDFRVEEKLSFERVPHGEYHVHLLTKEKLSTQEALARVVRSCGVDRGDIAYAGLKDRQAVTRQFLTVRRRSVSLEQPGLTLRPIGRTDQPITSKQSEGNRFTITIRDLTPPEAVAVRRSLPSLARTGLPNYFDDQRFGCLRHGQGFVLLHLLRGDPERALRQLVATPSDVAISGDVKLKKILSRCWGDWDACLDVVRGPVYEPVFRHLVRHPGDFAGAIEKVPTRNKLIHAFAFQSYLWNRALSRMLRTGVPFAKRLILETESGRLVAWRYMERDRQERLARMRTPLFGPDGDGGEPAFRDAMLAEIEEVGLTPGDFARRQVPGMVLVEEDRPAMVVPENVAPVEVGPDEIHRGRRRVVVCFDLPRGAYATMVIKRLFAPTAEEMRRRLDARQRRREGGRFHGRGRDGHRRTMSRRTR